LPQQIISLLASGTTNAIDELSRRIREVEQAHQTCLDAQKEAYKSVEIINSSSKVENNLSRQLAQLENWIRHIDSLAPFCYYNNLRGECQEKLGNGVLSYLETDPKASDELLANLCLHRWEALRDFAYASRPALRTFNPEEHQTYIEQFRSSDLKSMGNNRIRVAQVHYESLPAAQVEIGPMAILKREIAKKARHKPLRKLLQEAGPVIQKIKPVYMMSPLSVAAYLEPQTMSFDLVIFDEASQVPPVDAFGAIMRGKQLVVVGDSKQLPPTAFFGSTSTVSDEEDDNSMADVQSILGLAESKGMIQRTLKWHYRSRHQALIAVSNKEFYENKLVIFPSPGNEGERLGLFYRRVDSAYERGTSRTNPKEAAAIAEAVVKHANHSPHLSLGVVAFSTAQRDAILDCLEIKRQAAPHLDPKFFSKHPHEPFFVKNLENVQGDERDVMFISIGYGKDESGYLAMNFGPLNNEGGEKRLNVLISRAKRRCEVFTNLSYQDIDTTRSNKQGISALKSFLRYAETSILDTPKVSGREFDSVFEEQVSQALSNRGYTVHKQIGSGGFYIDLAVVDPDRPGRYLMGIECDGAMYHSAQSARDRDRLRETVLLGMGWTLYRVWGPHWYRDPAKELENLIRQIEAESLRLKEVEANDALNAEMEWVEEADFTFEVEDSETEVTGILRDESRTKKLETYPYVVAELPFFNSDVHSEPLGKRLEMINSIVKVEHPVHIDVLAKRITEAAGLLRTGSKIKQSIREAVNYAVKTGDLLLQGEFIHHPTAPITIRDRSAALSADIRRLEYIPQAEVEHGILECLSHAKTARLDEVSREVSRLMGFSATSANFVQLVDNGIRNLAVKQLITYEDNVVAIKEPV
jgi:very-short-patch-repair endonuclease